MVDLERCKAQVSVETTAGKEVSVTRCQFEVNGKKPCELSKQISDNTFTHVSDGFCLNNYPNNIPNPRKN